MPQDEIKEFNFTAKLNEAPADAAALLQQLAGNVNALTTVQFIVRVTTPNLEEEDLPSFVAIRQVFQADNGTKVRVTLLPDDLQQQPSVDIRDDNLAERADWLKLLGDPVNVDINTGTTLIRIPGPDQAGVAVWIPNDANPDNIIKASIPVIQPEGGSDTNLQDFFKCMKQQKALGKTYSQRWCECAHQL